MGHYRYRRSGLTSREAGAAVVAGLVLVAAAQTSHARASSHASHASHLSSATVAAVLAYARHQVGCPYVWGGTGPCSAGFDCSGLVMRAWQAAGISIPRTSQEQWASLPHASRPAPGDLVFAPGADGSWSSPGHVGLLLGGGRVEQAYATGYPVEVVSLSAFAAGAGGIVGYAEAR